MTSAHLESHAHVARTVQLQRGAARSRCVHGPLCGTSFSRGIHASFAPGLWLVALGLRALEWPSHRQASDGALADERHQFELGFPQFKRLWHAQRAPQLRPTHAAWHLLRRHARGVQSRPGNMAGLASAVLQLGAAAVLWFTFVVAAWRMRTRMPAGAEMDASFVAVSVSAPAGPLSVRISLPRGMPRHNLHAKTPLLSQDAVARFAAGRQRTRLLQHWFAAGPACAAAGAVAAVVLLCAPIAAHAGHALGLDTWARGSGNGGGGSDEQIGAASIEIAVPGLTVPWAMVIPLAVASAVSLAFHELGHALAAAAVRVPTRRVGCCCVLAVLPGVWVELDDDDDDDGDGGGGGGGGGGGDGDRPSAAVPAARGGACSLEDRLRYTAAGVWHNAVLCLASLLLLALLPIFAAPLWSVGRGAAVVATDARLDAGLRSVFTPGRLVVGVNDATVLSVSDWREALTAVAAAPSLFCIDKLTLEGAAVAPGADCCSENTTSPLQCFAWSTQSAAVGAAMKEPALTDGNLACVSARAALTSHFGFDVACRQQADCREGTVCAVPQLADPVHERVAVIRFLESDPVVFAGVPSHLAALVSVSDYAARNRLAEALGAGAPDGVSFFLRLLFSVSASLGVLNSAPVHYSDGARLLPLALALAAPRLGLSATLAGRAVRGTLRACSCLLAFNFLLALWKLLSAPRLSPHE
jgi:hypothetical protein